MKNRKRNNNVCYLIISFILRPIIFILMKTKIIGKENIPQDGFLLVGNHKSYYDSFVVGQITHRSITYLAKKELFENKVFKLFFNLLGLISVDRQNKNPKAKEMAIQKLHNGEIVCIFPEGTINRSKDIILPFKYGACSIGYKSGKQILPFAIIGKPQIFNYRTKIVIGKPFYVKTDNFKTETEKLENIIVDLIKENSNEGK